MTAVVFAETPTVPMGKVPEEAPSGMVIVAGTLAAPMSLESDMASPPAARALYLERDRLAASGGGIARPGERREGVGGPPGRRGRVTPRRGGFSGPRRHDRQAEVLSPDDGQRALQPGHLHRSRTEDA